MRPRHKRVRRGESKSAGYFFGRYLESYFEKGVKMGHTKIYSVDLNSLRRELFVRGLGFVVALLVCWQIDFSCDFCFGRATQVYSNQWEV